MVLALEWLSHRNRSADKWGLKINRSWHFGWIRDPLY